MAFGFEMMLLQEIGQLGSFGRDIKYAPATHERKLGVRIFNVLGFAPLTHAVNIGLFLLVHGVIINHMPVVLKTINAQVPVPLPLPCYALTLQKF